MPEPKLLTPEGASRLRAELEELKGPKRRKLAERLRAAIQQGDLSENADYTSAKEAQGFLEGRILELEALLRHATIVEPGQAPRGEVAIGSRVTVVVEGDPPEVFVLVGSTEADTRQGRISHESPFGRALMGHRAGDRVTAETPAGLLTLAIISID
ncbi:MAG: transcription elongation factor GreA [Chloroflexi bacterium]|nr:transcription elongation factor GreA [Chloroflexota bacterium]